MASRQSMKRKHQKDATEEGSHGSKKKRLSIDEEGSNPELQKKTYVQPSEKEQDNITDKDQMKARKRSKKKHRSDDAEESDQELQNTTQLLRQENGRLLEQVRILEYEKKTLVEAKEKALTRLSEVAGARLKHNNPDIADLSDPNRPTKLAEKFSELYDNEWTEAFEEMTNTQKSTENDTIAFLLSLLMKSYHICNTYIEEYQSNMLKMATTLPCLHKEEDTEEEPTQILPIEISKQLTDIIKNIARLSMEDAKKMILQTICAELSQYPWDNLEATRLYVAKCIELCWLMVIQTPPLYITEPDAARTEFDTSLFRSYTKRGDRLEFVVWPALFLYQNGPILSKGVAQGCKM